jgi:pimeloyl-ACP methyl ester carboxylesterase
MVPKQLISFQRVLRILIITIVVVVLSIQILTPVMLALAVTIPLKHRVCCETPARFGADYREMQFLTTDGLKLSGWYLPPRNGAVIILVHSYYADRRQTLPVAEMLYKHGYGLLMVDQRASGESQGTVRSLGALDIPDLERAANWLVSQDKISQIGAYGCSMGGAISLAGAVNVPAIRAVAADAPSPLRWFENLPPFSLRDPVSLPTMFFYYTFVRLGSGTTSPANTLDYIRDYGSRPILFISTGQGAELSRINAYYEAATGPKSHWNIPDASHCTGSTMYPQEYELHLVNFFNSTLLK